MTQNNTTQNDTPKEPCRYCGAVDPFTEHHPLRLEGDIPICLPCYKPMRDALLWQIAEENRVDREYADLKRWVADCARPEILAALRARLYEMGVRLDSPGKTG